MIEDVTSSDFPTYMKEEVLKLLGMNNSSFEKDDIISGKLAVGYEHLGQKISYYEFVEKVADLYTTSKDLAKFIVAFLNSSDGEKVGRRLFKPETVDFMFKEQ